MTTARLTINDHISTARYLTNLMDNKFKIGKFSFGLDPILGIIPGGGDVMGFFLSSYIVWIGIQLRLPAEKIAIMIGNTVYDFIIGSIPIFGDFVDFTFKANTRNMQIIEKYAPGGIHEGEVVE